MGLAIILNSAELASSFNLPNKTSPWDDVRRIYRRACVLRATGRSEEATHIESVELPRALENAQRDPLCSLQEQAVLAEEVERVTNAFILAELVGPMLAEQLRAEGSVITSASAPSAGKTEPKVDPAPTRAPSDEPPSIADLIDGMLSQERAQSPRSRS